jgi:hypothetical protein
MIWRRLYRDQYLRATSGSARSLQSYLLTDLRITQIRTDHVLRYTYTHLTEDA